MNNDLEGKSAQLSLDGSILRERTFIIENEQHKQRLGKSEKNLHSQFVSFAKFGDSGATGKRITLSQSDRWLRQAKVIDGWDLTMIDTAIAFRKISKGSIWLTYNAWKTFLEYLAKQKKLDFETILRKLEDCGRPNIGLFSNLNRM